MLFLYEASLRSTCRLETGSLTLLRSGREDPEGVQLYSSTLPSTSALDGGGWSTPRPDLFTPGKDPVPIV
jgi:hypothetical protein